LLVRASDAGQKLVGPAKSKLYLGPMPWIRHGLLAILGRREIGP
jgi:hypothetical protein